MSTFLFVYGTLRRHSLHPMARRLAEAARHVGAARIAGRLYNLGRFPGLKAPRTSEDWVQGDVYDLGENFERTLKEMDAYEDAEAPTSYQRQLAAVELDDGSSVAVWVYLHLGHVQEEQFIPSGSYEENCISEPEA